jgi:hypothetical protein
MSKYLLKKKLTITFTKSKVADLREATQSREQAMSGLKINQDSIIFDQYRCDVTLLYLPLKKTQHLLEGGHRPPAIGWHVSNGGQCPPY